MNRIVLIKETLPIPRVVATYQEISWVIGNLTINNPKEITFCWKEMSDKTCIIYLHNATDDEVLTVKDTLSTMIVYVLWEVYNNVEEVEVLRTKSPWEFI